MTTLEPRPKCASCGSHEGLPLRSDGHPSSICIACRRREIIDKRLGYRPARSDPPPCTSSYAAHKTATQRAIELASREKIPMLEALRREGVI